MGRTAIGWTDLTCNPGLYGCTAVSPACEHCYAASMALRLATMPHTKDRYEGAAVRVHGRAAWTGKVKVDFDQIALSFAKLPKGLKRCEACDGDGTVPANQGPPMAQETGEARSECGACGGSGRRPWRCFLTSMSDLFHPDVPYDFIQDVFVEMAKRPHIHFQVLTKRPARMAEFAQEIVFAGRRRGPDASQPVPWVWPENVWAGTTVEDQQRADERIPWLRQIPAKVRFLSVEPMLGAVDISNHLWPACWHWDGRFDSPEAALAADDGWAKQKPQGLLSSHVAKTLINWVIVGGESGHHARPSSPAWFRSLREQCEGSGTAFFFKQWGEWVPGNGYAGDDLYDRVRKQHDGTLFGDDRKGTGSGVRSGFFNYNDVWHELGPNPFRQTMDRVGRANDPQTLDGIEHHAFPRTP